MGRNTFGTKKKGGVGRWGGHAAIITNMVLYMVQHAVIQTYFINLITVFLQGWWSKGGGRVGGGGWCSREGGADLFW